MLRPTSLVLATIIGVVASLLLSPSSEAQGNIRPGGTSRGGTTTAGRTGTTGARTGVGGTSGVSSASGRSYRSNTQLGDAIIQIDPETRSIIIVTDEETNAQLGKVIEDLDRPKPQVLIKVVFLEVTYNKQSDIGVEGSYTFKLNNGTPATNAGTSQTTTTTTTPNANGGTTTTSNVVNQTTTAAAATASTVALQSLFGLATTTAGGSFVRVASDDWSATLHALAQRGKVEVLSRPSIMARNNQEAVIVVGQEVPFITNSRTDSLGNLTNTIQYDNVGIILRVTPFITSSNSVEMIVAPEISALTSQTVPISNNASAPVISKRSAETVVVTPNGTTAVIGGLMQTQRISNVDKIPILGDIPGLGTLFRHKTTNDVKTELLIFLTPTIINTTEGIEASTAKDVRNTELVKQAFTEQEFDKFFDSLPVKNTQPIIPALENQSSKRSEKAVTTISTTKTDAGNVSKRTTRTTTGTTTTKSTTIQTPSSTPRPLQTPKKVPRSRDPAAQAPIL